MQLVDVHCHLESTEFAGILEDVLAGARQAGVLAMVTASIVPSQWPLSLSLARSHTEISCAWGVHPWYARPEHEAFLPDLLEARNAGVAAIGEIGLDRKTLAVPVELQLRFFERQLRIARDLDLPAVIHCRAAFDLLLPALRSTGVSSQGAVIHNFSGSAELATQLSSFGVSFSLGGALTYRNSRKKREVLRAIYPARFLLETDSPDIPPVEVRVRPNIPANIIYSLAAAAESLGVDEEEIAESTTRNAARIFGLDF